MSNDIVKADQIAYHFFSKLSLVIDQARSTDELTKSSAWLNERQPLMYMHMPKMVGAGTDKWFSLEVPGLSDAHVFSDHLKTYLSVSKDHPPPLELQVLLSVPDLKTNQVLVYQSESSLVAVKPTPRRILLETWKLDFELASPLIDNPSSEEKVTPSAMYKQCISIFRSLFSLLRVLPTWALYKRLGKGYRDQKQNLGIIVRMSPSDKSARVTNDIFKMESLPGAVSSSPNYLQHIFPHIPHPSGYLVLTAYYLATPNFRVQEQESLLSERFRDSPDNFPDNFSPTSMPMDIPSVREVKMSDLSDFVLGNPNQARHVLGNQPPPHIRTAHRFNGDRMRIPPYQDDTLASLLKLWMEDREMIGQAFPVKKFDFTTTVSHWIDPDGWIRLNIQHVKNILDALRLSQGFSAGANSIEGIKIYQRLTVTVYTMACLAWHSKLPEFKRKLEIWSSWDEITSLIKHRTVVDYLLACQSSIRGSDTNRPQLLFIEELLQRLHQFDNVAIDAQMLSVLGDPTRQKNLLTRRGPEAQALLNLLQARLDFVQDESCKHLYVSTLIKLSRAASLYPECMTLKGVKLNGSAVDGGSYGDVFISTFKGQEIAVKVLKVYQKSDIDKLLKEFFCEAVIWRQLHHPNILPFYGVYHLETENTRVCLASPWMKNGNIIQFLEAAPETNCVPLILDIASGLEYLHTLKPAIVHGDLKGVNILVTQSGRACLADFGLATARESRTLVETSSTTNRRGGTLRWQAPELLKDDNERNSPASDVYAFACVCYEMLSGHVPFHDIKNDYRIILAVTSEGRRPPRPLHDLCRTRGLTDKIWDVVESCWDGNPTQRLSAHHIVEKLQTLLSGEPDMRPLDQFDPSFASRTLHSQETPSLIRSDPTGQSDDTSDLHIPENSR